MHQSSVLPEIVIEQTNFVLAKQTHIMGLFKHKISLLLYCQICNNQIYLPVLLLKSARRRMSIN